MPYLKSGLPFLFDDTTNDIIGIRDVDGGDTYFPTAVFTWATLPAAGLCRGSAVRVSDVGVAPGARFVSDGSIWRPDGPIVLARLTVGASVTGTTNETTLATVTIPAGVMGTNGSLEIRTSWSHTNSANNKTLRVRLGGIGGTAFLQGVVTTIATSSDIRSISNRNGASSQIGSMSANSVGGTASSSAALPTGTVNTAVSQDLVISAQNASAAETTTLERAIVLLLP